MFDTGIVNDLSDPNSIADPIVLASAMAVENPISLGRFWNDMAELLEPSANRQYDINSRSETPRGGTTGAWADGVATTNLAITSTNGLIAGLVLQIEAEVVIIAEVVSGTLINVKKRGAAGTTGVSHADTTPFTVIGSAINDEDLKDIGSVSELTNTFQNYFQTVAEPIDFTKSTETDPRKVSPRMMQVLQTEASYRIFRNLAASSIYGVRQKKVDQFTPWMSAGLVQQLTEDEGGTRLTLEEANVGALTETKFKAALRKVCERGVPTDCYVSQDNKDIINEFKGAGSSVNLNSEQTNTRAGYYVDSYDFEGLVINIKIDLALPNDIIPIVNIRKCFKGWRAGDQLTYNDEGKASSREFRNSFNGSFTTAIENVGYDHIAMTGITT